MHPVCRKAGCVTASAPRPGLYSDFAGMQDALGARCSDENPSMKIVSAAEMRDIDRATSERFGVASVTLMENAGAAVARFILSDYPRAERIGILCGKGNNGGDGFVVARKLVEAGRAIRLLLLSDPEELRGDAANMYQGLLRKLQPLNIASIMVRDPSTLDSPGAAEG